MTALQALALQLLATCIACNHGHQVSDLATSCDHDSTTQAVPGHNNIRGALLATRFKSLEDLQTVVDIQYVHAPFTVRHGQYGGSAVRLSHCSNGKQVVSSLKWGISEEDFARAQDGNLGDRLSVGLNSPYTVKNRQDLQRVSLLARRRSDLFEAGDVAFYDLAEKTVDNIAEWDFAQIEPSDLTEKGYLNTFNHITAQAFMTSLFSEGIADFMADAHERKTMPELITGRFTEEQLADSINNPVDNYVDMINNEWGQELGKQLKVKYTITRQLYWTPQLMAAYLNDIQTYYTWALQIGFEPFRAEDEVVSRFADKVNRVMDSRPEML